MLKVTSRDLAGIWLKLQHRHVWSAVSSVVELLRLLGKEQKNPQT